MIDTDFDLKFSAGSIDITPRYPVHLAGYGSRTEIYSEISDKLEANVVLLKQGDACYLILSLDLLYVGKLIINELFQLLSGRIKKENMLISATHTHFAPATDPTKPLLGKIDEGYLRFVLDQLKTLLNVLLDSDPKPCRIAYGTYTANHSINRRLFRRIVIGKRGPQFNKTQLAPNPNGLRDELLHTLSIEKPSGETVCILWNYCCHPVGFPKINNVSADYPGAVRAVLRKTFGEHLSVLFLQGFAGDVRPRGGGRHSLKARLQRLVQGPIFYGFIENEWRQWTDTLSSSVVEAVRSAKLNIVPHGGGIWSKRLEIPLVRLLPNERENRFVLFYCMALGPCVRLIGISAEPVVEYTMFTKGLSQGSIIIPIGCIDDVFGYLPAENMIGLAGYEDSGFLKDFSLSSPWSPGFESECRNALNSLLK